MLAVLSERDRENAIFPEAEVPTINCVENSYAIYFSEIFKNLLDLSIPLIEANASVRQSVKKKITSSSSHQHQPTGRRDRDQRKVSNGQKIPKGANEVEVTDEGEHVLSYHLKVNLDGKRVSKTEDGLKQTTETWGKHGMFQLQKAELLVGTPTWQLYVQPLSVDASQTWAVGRKEEAKKGSLECDAGRGKQGRGRPGTVSPAPCTGVDVLSQEAGAGSLGRTARSRERGQGTHTADTASGEEPKVRKQPPTIVWLPLRLVSKDTMIWTEHLLSTVLSVK